MDYIHQPYVGTFRSAAGAIYRVAWFPARDDATVFPLETPLRSNRYLPVDFNAETMIGSLPTDNLDWSPFWNVKAPSRVCGTCHIGDDSWWTDAEWPSDAPPVTIGDDGFTLHCKESEMGVQSVGLAAPRPFRVSGSPVTSRGTLSLDWELGISVGQVPTVQPDGTVLFQDPSPGLPQVFSAMLGVSGECTALVSSAISTTVDGTSPAFGVSSADGQQIGVQMIAAGTGIPTGAETIEWTPGGTGGGFDINTVSAGTVPATFTPIGYSWTELGPNAVTGELQIKTGGRTGTYLASPAFQIGGNPLQILNPGTIVWMRFRGTVQGLDVYDFLPPPPAIGQDITVGGPTQIFPTTINYYGGSSSNQTTINYNNNVILQFFNGTTLVPIFTGPTINPILLPPATGSYWIPFDFQAGDETQIGSDYYYFLCGLPARSIALRIVTRIDLAFVGLSFASYGFIKLSDTSHRNNLGSFRYFNTNDCIYQFTDVPVDPWNTINDGSYSLAVWIGTTLPSAGRIVGQMEVIQLQL